MLLEICVDSIESALAAVEGGASRLELCSSLNLGGLTPTPGLLKILKIDLGVTIPIYCMLRPNHSNDFIYSEHEIQSILYDMKMLQQIGSDGFVFGALTSNQEINIEQCELIKKHSSNLPLTFHRAFDLTKSAKMLETCNIVKSLGFQRILTSGFKRTAEIGIENLKKLIIEQNDVVIMPGAGINAKNLRKIITETNCTEFHGSAKIKKVLNFKSNLSMGNSNTSNLEDVYITDKSIVQDLVGIAKSFEEMKGNSC